MRAEEYPFPSSPAASAVMRSNRKTDSKPEVRLRSALHRRGLRFRKNVLIRTDTVAVRPDIVFPARKVAVFVDGCFWHRCPEHGVSPRTNVDYWRAKLDRNVERDSRVADSLGDAGWRVLRIWEHVIAEDAVSIVIDALVGPRLRVSAALHCMRQSSSLVWTSARYGGAGSSAEGLTLT